MTLIPWRAGKPVVWDMIVVCTCADSYVEASAREAGTAAEFAVACMVEWQSIPTCQTSTPSIRSQWRC